MRPYRNKTTLNVFHVGFEIALFFKAMSAGFEVLCGIVLFFFSPAAANRLIEQLTRAELNSDPNDILANFLVHLGGSFTVHVHQYAIFYLLSHGAVKLVIVWLLWREKLWAYPLAILVLCFFVIYQVFAYAASPSLLLVLLTVLDSVVIALTLAEYQGQRRRISKSE